MKEQDDDSANIAAWLQEAGKRRIPSPPVAEDDAQSAEGVLAYLESLAGRRLRSSRAIDALLTDLASDHAARVREATGTTRRRNVLLLVALVAAFFNYYYWDVNVQIARVPAITVFIPVADSPSPAQHTGGT